MADETMEAATAVAQESPEAAGILASIIDHNARWREAMLPTWEELAEAERRAYDQGYANGVLQERHRIMGRLFGWEEVTDD